MKLYEFSLSSVYLDPAIFQDRVLQFIKHPLLRAHILYYMRILQPLPEGFIGTERIIGAMETKPLKKIGILYLMLMNLYLGHVDEYILDCLRKYELPCFWYRTFTTGLLFYIDKSTVKANRCLALDAHLPKWGLSVKVCTKIHLSTMPPL